MPPARTGTPPAAVIAGSRVEVSVDAGGVATILRLPEREQIGEIGYRLSGERLVFEGMEVTPALRGLGLGSEAVRLLEGWSRRRGTLRCEALVPKSLGLALYFWLRLGYRPSNVDEAGAFPMMRAML
jgi:GNAT superfamily N-acetyltransferase